MYYKNYDCDFKYFCSMYVVYSNFPAKYVDILDWVRRTLILLQYSVRIFNILILSSFGGIFLFKVNFLRPISVYQCLAAYCGRHSMQCRRCNRTRWMILESTSC